MPDHRRGQRIAQGRTAEIFAWGEDRALKLFRKDFPGASVGQEADITRKVHAAGLPVPEIEGVVEVEGRRGIVFARIDGPSLLENIASKPWTLAAAARLLAELHAAIHTRTLPELPSQRLRLESRIRGAEILTVSTKDAVLRALGDLPDGSVLCHGDFHPGNILLSPRGAIVIDWMDASAGNPLADVARTAVLLRLGVLPPGTIGRWLLESGRILFHRVYLRRYIQLRPVSREQIAAWHLPVAAARLAEDIPEQGRLLGLIQALLANQA